MINRRQWLCGMGIIASAAAQPGRAVATSKKDTPENGKSFAGPGWRSEFLWPQVMFPHVFFVAIGILGYLLTPFLLRK